MSLLYGSEFEDKTTFPTTKGEVLYGLFRDNTTLVNAKDLILPTTTLTYQCYYYMFYGCSSLTTAPELPATTLAEACYCNMFGQCSSLTTAPELPATTLAEGCYSGMFAFCSKLNYVCALFTETPNTNYKTYNWLYGVSETGTFLMNPDATWNPEDYRGESGIPTGWTVVTKAYTDTHVYIVNESNNINTLIINNNGPDLQYLVDMETEWLPLSGNLNIPFKYGITLKGNNTSLNGCRIRTTNDSTLNGNIMALLYGDDYEDKTLFPEGSENTFKYLFLGYNKLTDISNLQLPATTLTPNCYHHMFTGCTSLTKISTLPAQNLTDSCYHGMFMGCDSIDKVNLPEAYLAPYAYSNMFLGSNNLSDVTVTYNENIDKTNYKGWLNGVSVNGKFTYNHTEEVDSNIIKTNYHIPGNWEIKYRDPTAINYFYIEDISSEPNVFSINKQEYGIAAPELNLEYSTDTQSWTVLEGNTIDIPANSKVYLRGYNDGTAVGKGGSAFNIFTCSGQYNVGGNIMSLLYSNECMVKDTLTTDFTFMNLFYNNKTLVNSQDLQLPATTLTNSCYDNMFADCPSLTTAPSILPATTLAECCYYEMFIGCHNLTTTPELPATTLAPYCYYGMFNGCTSLTKAPELPATTLAESCYESMFSGCTGLTKAPELPATTLANYCYYGMFDGCSSLNYIKADFINYSNDNNEFTDWVNGVSSTGTFVMNPNANYIPDDIRGIDGIPEGWTVLTSEE